MARFKSLAFLGFLVVSLGLALAALSGVSGRLADVSTKQLAERLAWGQVLFETSGRLGQSYRAMALAAAAADPAMVEAAGVLTDAPPVAAAETARKLIPVALERIAPGMRRPTFFLVGTERGLAVIPGDGGPALTRDDKSLFGLPAAGRAGPQGLHALVDGKIYRVTAVPLRVSGTEGEKQVGWLGAAVVLDDAFAEEQAKDLTMSVTATSGGLSVSSLPDRQRAIAMAAKDGPVALPPSESLGFIALPAFTRNAPAAQARSFALEGIDGGRVVLIAQSGSLPVLVDFQRRSLLGLFAFGLLGVAVLALSFLPGSKANAGAERREEPTSDAVPKVNVEAPTLGPPSFPEVPQQDLPGTAAAPMAPVEETHSEEASTPWRQEPFAQAPAAPAFEYPAGGLPFHSAPADPPFEPMPAPPPTPMAEPQELAANPSPMAPDDDYVGAPTYPFGIPPTGLDMSVPGGMVAPDVVPLPAPSSSSAFASAVPLPAPSLPNEPAFLSSAANDSFNAFAPPRVPTPAPGFAESTVAATPPEELLQTTARPPLPTPSEATVVSQVPEELLRASARRPVAAPLPSSGMSTADDLHFQDVFQQFLATRAQCNEASEGLTFEKFATKLRKNREQLMQKYNCKSVRFQVYVKEGKAALKATPIRE